ncbi:MAG: C69 family dipeptidase [Bacteroidales bacterium]|nr:C69 family dipeptidase [Bacteroidales bacterium]
MKRYIPLLLILLIAGSMNVHPCTIIAAGKKATKEGSVLVSHSDAGADCRFRVIPRMQFPAGAMTPVYWGIQNEQQPLDQFGDTLGFIPQVEETFQYIHSAYSHINEFQLAIGESTMSQKEELQVDRDSTTRQIMTVEQAMIFALQRCKTARQALILITGLMDTYGYLPSCGPESECLAIADPNEVWVLELFSVGPDWAPGNGNPGALWAAQRLPDDEVTMIPNWSIIKQIDINDTNTFRVSSNYQQIAIGHGWWDPDSGREFIWQDVYAPVPREWATSRFWLFNALYNPDLTGLPNRWTTDPFKGDDQYTQFVEPLSLYPFSFKPNKKFTVQDIMAFQRSTFTGTIYDKEMAPEWYLPTDSGTLVRSVLTTPFPTIELRKLLNINRRRNVARARGEYGMIAQLRSWLPNEVGGIYYVYVDNAYTSAYVPIYAGVTDVAECYKRWDKEHFDDNSIRWCVDFVDNLQYLRWQDAVKTVREARDPLEQQFFEDQPEIDRIVAELLLEDPAKGKAYLTNLTIERMELVHQLFKDLRIELIEKYSNNKQGI